MADCAGKVIPTRFEFMPRMGTALIIFSRETHCYCLQVFFESNGPHIMLWEHPRTLDLPSFPSNVPVGYFAGIKPIKNTE